MTTTPQTWPDWYDGKHINEVLFCQQFLEKHPMKCVRGRLFTVDGGFGTFPLHSHFGRNPSFVCRQ